MSDELPTAARVSDPGIRALYRLENRWQAWLDVEAALAKAQEELGIIPKGAAAAIARAARLELLDRARIDEGFARTGHTIVPLVWELSRVTGEPYGGWVHWGATTQNITQTGDLLVLRQAHRIFLGLIGEALSAMADLAERGADMPIAGRTHGQHAVPATFGYKPAVWIDEMIRHVERLRQAAPRLFVAMLGGGAGTFASLGAAGPGGAGGDGQASRHAADAGAVAHDRRPSRREHLPLRPPRRDLRQDRARDLHPDEDRVRRGRGAGAARHGRQLDDAAKAQPQALPGHHRRRGRSPRQRAPWRLEAMQTEHEADRTTSLIMDAAEARASIALGDALSRLVEVLRGLRLDPDRMRRNLDLGGGLIMAEAVMLDLGAADRPPARPRRRLRCRAGGLCRRPRPSPSCWRPTRASPRISTQRQIAALLDPTAYTGLCAEMARDAAIRARATAADISGRTETSGDGVIRSGLSPACIG